MTIVWKWKDFKWSGQAPRWHLAYDDVMDIVFKGYYTVCISGRFVRHIGTNIMHSLVGVANSTLKGIILLHHWSWIDQKMALTHNTKITRL